MRFLLPAFLSVLLLLSSAYAVDLHPELRQFIHEILIELEIDPGTVHLMSFSQDDIEEFGDNIYVQRNCFKGGYIMAFNQEWLMWLSEGMRRFVIGHEAIHIKLGHCDPIYDDNVSKEIEEQADIEAALCLNCIQGGILFCTMLKDAQAYMEDSFFGNEYPSPDERIAYLTALL